jgi:two-component system response regulator YesN
MDRKIKVLIVDDQRRSRQSLQALLATWPAAASIREAANGVEALHMAEEFRPDLVLIDVRMPQMVG